jgi:two-component system, LytTR family, response regulator
MKINAVIVEDEKKSAELMLALLKKHCPEISVLGIAGNVDTAVEMIKKEKPDLVFLDIQLTDGTGFDILTRIPDQNFEIIFATAFDQYAIKAIKYSALDYLLKPINGEELKSAVRKIIEKKSSFSNVENLKFLIQNLKKSDEDFSIITLPTGNAYEIVNIADIIRCEASESYTYFFLVGGKKFLVTTGLKHYEDILPSSQFIRVHHHHLINMNHVVRYLKTDGGYAIMSDNSKIEISRRKRESFLERLNRV